MQNILLNIDEKFGTERALRKFKRMCDNYGIVKEYRSRQEYKKPSLKLKEKQEAAMKRRRKLEFKSYRTRSKI